MCEPNTDPPENFDDGMETIFKHILWNMLYSMKYQPTKIVSFNQRWCDIEEHSFFDVQFVELSNPAGNREIEIPLWQMIAFIYSSNNKKQ